MPIISGGGGGAGTSGLTRLFNSVASGAVASIDTGANGVAGTASSLLIVVVARSDRAGANVDTVALRFNGDTGANYYAENVSTTGTTAPVSNESLGQTSAQTMGCPGATATANWFASVILFVPSYASTTPNKSVVYLDDYAKALTTNNIAATTGGLHWNSTAAINQVAIFAANGNLIAGSRLTIYGLA